MSNEKRQYPRVDISGEANLFLQGAAGNANLLNISPTGIQIECTQTVVEKLSQHKSEAGIFPAFDMEFFLPSSDSAGMLIKVSCNVCYCRRLSQDNYNLGLYFVDVGEHEEKRLLEYISKKIAA